MAKKGKLEEKLGGETPAEEVSKEAAAEASAAVEKAKATSRTRGPKGVKEDAVITLLATANPKRADSKAHRAFGNYRNGMTVKEFADALDADDLLKGTSTGHLVYDAKHGFISIEGYDPGAIITPKPKDPKAPKAKKVKSAEAEQGEVAAQAEAQAEQME